MAGNPLPDQLSDVEAVSLIELFDKVILTQSLPTLAGSLLPGLVHMIQQASREIEAAINSLQNLTEICTVKYISEGQARMIDLKTELEAPLATKAIKEQHES